MNEILLFESSGSMEYFPNPETIEEYKTNVEQSASLDEELGTDHQEEIEEDQEEQLEEDPEEQLEEDPEEVKEENTEEGNKNDVLQVSDVQTDIYISDDPEHVSDNQIVSVSENIINKPLNEYTVSESLQLYIFISLFVAGFIVLVRRAVLKWL